ncbi:MAG: glycerol kinase GlpK [Pseudomonadota bacterium]
MTSVGILALDQGTTSSRAIIFDKNGTPLFRAQKEFPQVYPADGWVEHDPEEIWASIIEVARAVLQAAEEGDVDVVAMGITNQRETVMVWDRATGVPLTNALVWQDRRTANDVARLSEEGHEPTVRLKTGLLLDPYFSATKIAWVLDNVEGARARAERGELACGTIDSFLIWRLTGGRVHATDATNASRTSLYDIEKGDWDDELLDIFRVPRQLLPKIGNCADDYGVCLAEILGSEVPIRGVAGDQQAAAFGQACFDVGSLKSTYGTGCFALLNTGNQVTRSKHRLLSTIAYQLNGEVTYALEGSIFIAGAAVQWLRDELGVLTTSAETAERAARATPDTNVIMVPAFTGMGAPYWQPNARAAIFGMTRATGPDELARAALEGVVYQTHDLFEAMGRDGVALDVLRIDGGMTANDWFVQRLSDILNIPIDRPQILETTALGAAYLAGLSVGIFNSLDEISRHWSCQKRFEPTSHPDVRAAALERWRKCVDAVLAVSP